MNLFPFDTVTAKYLNTVLILCGPPASGKSTFIKKNISKKYHILSRDDIRGMAFGRSYKPNSRKEEQVTNAYNFRLKYLAGTGQYIVVDKTNCNQAHFDAEIKLFEEYGYTIFIKFFDVSYRTLIFREIKRRLTDRSKPSVPFKVIKDMKKRYDKIDKSKYAKYILH